MPTRSTKSWYCRHAGIGSSKCLHLNRDFTNEITSLSLEAAEPLKLTNPQASPSLMKTYFDENVLAPRIGECVRSASRSYRAIAPLASRTPRAKDQLRECQANGGLLGQWEWAEFVTRQRVCGQSPRSNEQNYSGPDRTRCRLSFFKRYALRGFFAMLPPAQARHSVLIECAQG